MYKHILLTVDPKEASSWRKALPTSVELCRAFDATLHLMTVVPDFGMTVVAQYFPEDFEEKATRAADAELRDLARAHLPADVTCRRIVANGTIYEEILRVSRDIDADLIVMASHRPELKDYLIGPNAARVVRHADCSVLVVRD